MLLCNIEEAVFLIGVQGHRNRKLLMTAAILPHCLDAHTVALQPSNPSLPLLKETRRPLLPMLITTSPIVVVRSPPVQRWRSHALGRYSIQSPLPQPRQVQLTMS